MTSNYSKSLYKDYEDLMKKYENQSLMLKESNKLMGQSLFLWELTIQGRV